MAAIHVGRSEEEVGEKIDRCLADGLVKTGYSFSFSTITNGKVNEFNRALKTMNIDILPQQNITERHLGRKGLHLNPKGDSQLAMNVIDKIRSFSY